MKLDLLSRYTSAIDSVPTILDWRISGETDLLTDVVLCPPDYLAPVPCCTVTRDNLEQGFAVDMPAAKRQHEALCAALRRNGVTCHLVTPEPDLPDMCFTRDIAVATPFGPMLTAPAMPHRRGETEALARHVRAWGLNWPRVTTGTIEGGDICIAREGLLLIGSSGERTSREGLEEFAAPFHDAGWEVLVCPFHADHLHLDTLFCMVSPDEALACVELLDASFVARLRELGIALIDMPAASVPQLGCNILALGGKKIIASEDDEAVSRLRARDYHVETVDVSQFTRCGGGIHCLTLPVRRVPGARGG